jgi:AAA domain, putative AbiEii toxin, Type IV TA system
MSVILKKPSWIARLVRGHFERKICVASGSNLVLPTLDNLSAGQTSLLSIFGTILRYADFGTTLRSALDIDGIVLVDEIDAHLHADLQHDVLPELMSMFPKVQFIVTSHAPLFPLGMQKRFGDDGFALIELPSGLMIDAERFSEFESSLTYFRATQRFELEVRNKVSQSQRPLILCEGETDPVYLTAAAELLDYDGLVATVDFDWVGQRTDTGGSEGAGKSNLDAARRFLLNNPQCMSRRIVLLFDCDANKANEDHGKLSVRCIPQKPKNKKAPIGIENLLPETVLKPKFYTETTRQSGCDTVTRKMLNKMELCRTLCGERRKREHFVEFAAILGELRRVIGADGQLTVDVASATPASAKIESEAPAGFTSTSNAVDDPGETIVVSGIAEC